MDELFRGRFEEMCTMASRLSLISWSCSVHAIEDDAWSVDVACIKSIMASEFGAFPQTLLESNIISWYGVHTMLLGDLRLCPFHKS